MRATQAKSDTRLPRAVVRRSEAIQARIDAQQAALETDPPSDDPATPTPAPAPDGTNIIENPTPSPDALPEPPAPIGEVVDWEQRARSAQGRLTALARQHREEVDGLKVAIAELVGEVESLKASQPAAKLELGAYFTPEQIEQFGEDQCEAMLVGAEKRTREVLQESLKPLVDGRKQDEADALAQRKQAFIAKLQELVPDYETIDNDPAWTDIWLEGEDDTTGDFRGEILNRHVKNFDAPRAAKLFQAFKNSRAKPPTPPVAPNGTGANGGGDPPPAGPRLTTPTASEIRDFHKRAATKKPGQFGYVTDQERANFEARMALRNR